MATAKTQKVSEAAAPGAVTAGPDEDAPATAAPNPLGTAGPRLSPGYLHNRQGTPSGAVIDGAAYQLEGEPPAAVSQGWGYMGWLRRGY